MKTKLISLTAAFALLVTTMSTTSISDRSSREKEVIPEVELMTCPTCPEVTNWVYQGDSYWTWSASTPSPNWGYSGWQVLVYGTESNGSGFEDEQHIFSTGYDTEIQTGISWDDTPHSINSSNQSCMTIFVEQWCKDSSGQPVCLGETKFEYNCPLEE